MASLADLLAAAAGGQLVPPPDRENTLDRLLSPAAGSNFLDQLLQLSGRGGGGRGPAPIGGGPAPRGASVNMSGIATGNALPPGSPLLDTRRGVTLQNDALMALLQAARRYDAMPGARELGLFGPQSTYRTPAEQAALYANKPGVAAPPGQSYHQQGLAIDVPSQLQTDAFERLLRRLGWNQGLSFGEPWHWSYGVTG